MVLDHFIFYKKNFTSSAKRNSFSFYNFWNIKNKFKHLSIKKKGNSGRNDSGRVIIRTKTSLLIKKKFVNINYHLRYLKMGSILSFTFIPFKNKILSLVFFNNGSVAYYLTTNVHILFSFSCFIKHKRLKKFKIKSLYLMLFQIKKLSFISCLELLPGYGSQYSRSPGTKSRIIKFDKNSHSVLVELPSKIKKIFSFYSFTLLDAITLSMHKKCFNTKFGFWRAFGKKPIVRGVAMNAVDHPNGGRTKSVKYPKTPWGKTTKFK